MIPKITVHFMLIPAPHQQRIIDLNPRKILLDWETRSGKSLPASVWVNMLCRSERAYIICKKQDKKDWEAIAGEAKVLTKEEFKKVDIINPTALVVDEAHFFGSALFVRRGKGRSQLAEKLYRLCKTYPEMDIMLLTATPIRNDAWSYHTLLCYLGVYYDWKVWRNEFFELKQQHYLPRMPWMRAGEVPTAWFPKEDWRMRIRKYRESHGDIVLFKDVVEELPPAKETIIKIKHKPYKQPEDEVVTWVHEHKYEQGGKAAEIMALGFNKVIVVAHYTSQIDQLTKELSAEGRIVYVLDGRTRDADAVKKAAQASAECYFIVQASMGSGFDGWMFGAIVFASMSHSYVNYKQMLGRLLHPKHMKGINYYYLIGGRWDQRIFETVQAGKDFDPSVYR